LLSALLACIDGGWSLAVVVRLNAAIGAAFALHLQALALRLMRSNSRAKFATHVKRFYSDCLQYDAVPNSATWARAMYCRTRNTNRSHTGENTMAHDLAVLNGKYAMFMVGTREDAWHKLGNGVIPP
jgi:hypothetical protein